ncbi:helix-turn-helix domain-containing protein [Falsiroseomonas sp. E2-1-a20]|uniref:helix-turn-helix domain-containing protein n=1 Tax=Falsiroseomonas sp. E2-1-a20 TaxID=3239300 RepID=UPI003F362C28
MSATLHPLRTRPKRLRAEQAENLRQHVLAFGEMPADLRSGMLAFIDAETASENGWTFVMLSAAANDRVVSWLLENSATPIIAMRVWTKLFLSLRRDTGEIVKTRDELADVAGVTPRDVTRVMGELASIGAISRKREKVAGLRGPGVVRYFMNPWIATHLPGKVRDKAQAEAPLLRLVETP